MFVIPSVNPIAFNIFGISVYKYGITMALAIFVAVILANKLYNDCNFGKILFKKDLILEYSPIIIIIGILGARLYFCALNPIYYFAHPLEILDIRQGGLSIHGAIIAGVTGMILAAQKENLSFYSVIDPLACATTLGQSIGRWGNYFNSEAFGIPVNGQEWGLFIPQNLRPEKYANFELFHPTFLYESILNFVAFSILFFIYKNFGKKYYGLTFFSYLFLYAIIRFFVEQLRIDSAFYVGGEISIAIVVSVFMFCIGVIGILKVIFSHN